MDTSPEPIQQPQPQAVTPPTQTGDYTSDPVATFKTGAKKFWENSKQALPGIVVVEFLAILGCAVAMVIAIGAILVQILSAATSDPSASIFIAAFTQQLPPETLQAMTTLAQAPQWLIGVALVGFVAAIFLGTFSQALPVALAGATALNQKAMLGQVVRQTAKAFWPLLAQMLLIGLVVLGAFLVPALLLSSVSDFNVTDPPSGALLALPLVFFAEVIALLYFCMRLGFAPISVVLEKQGPIQSLKYSWQITKGRTWEIAGLMGILFIVSTITSLPFLILEAVSREATGVAFAINIVSLLVSVLVTFVITAAFVERYAQFKAAPVTAHVQNKKKNIMVFIAGIVFLIVGSMISNALAPSPAAPTTQTLPGQSNDAQIQEMLNNDPDSFDQLQGDSDPSSDSTYPTDDTTTPYDEGSTDYYDEVTPPSNNDSLY